MITQSSGAVLFNQNDEDKQQRNSLAGNTNTQNVYEQEQEDISLQGRIESGIKQKSESSYKRDTLGVLVTEQEWGLISQASATSEDPDSELQKYAAAITFSREFEIPVEAAMQNLEALTQYQLGQSYTAQKSTVDAIKNSFQIGNITLQRSDLMVAYRKADMKGEDTTQIEAQIQELDNQIASLEDYAPRSWATQLLKWTGKNAAYGFDVAGRGLAVGAGSALALSAIALATGLTFASGGIAAPLAASVIPVAMSTLVSAGTAAGTMSRAAELERGTLYYELKKQGVDTKTADYASAFSGVITGVTEALFNQIGGAALEAMGAGNFAGSVASKITSKLAVSGTLGALVNGLARYGVDAAGEFPQEFVQSVTNSVASDIAYEVSEVIPPSRSIPILKQAVQEGIQGFGVGLVMGFLPGVVNTSLDVQSAGDIRKQAQANPSKESFVKAMKDRRPESMTASDWSDTTAQIWETTHSGQTVSTVVQSEEAAVNEMDAGSGQTPHGIVKRTEAGELYTQESQNVTVDTAGVEHHSMKIGDPGTGKRYGYIDYALEGNTLTIEDVRVRPEFESIRKEAVLSLTKQYEGYNIEWEAKGENLESIRDEIIAENPRGKDAGLQYYDGVTDIDERLKLEGTIGKAMPKLNAAERSVAATMLQLRAEAKGMSTDAYLMQYTKNGNLFGDAKIDKINLGINQKGAAVFRMIDDDVKAVIYAGERGDFSTFAHETFHVFRREMEQTEQLQDAFKNVAHTTEFKKYISNHKNLFSDEIFDGMDSEAIAAELSEFGESWTRTQEEIAARLWEAYLLGGQTSSAKLQNLFRRISELMRKLYDVLRKKADLDPKIIEVFDSILDSESPLAQNSRKMESHNIQTGVAAQTETLNQVSAWHGSPHSFDRLFQSAPSTDSQAFKDWFGNSKVVDENGDPLVVYHGTNADFTVFEEGMGKEFKNRGIFFTDNRDVSDAFGGDSRTVEAYISMQNPLEVDAKGSHWLKIEFEGESTNSDMLAGIARERGYDGVIIRNVKDPYPLQGTSYIAFSSNQIKSVYNSGSWEQNNPDIFFQASPRFDGIYQDFRNEDLDIAKRYETWEDFQESYILDVGFDVEILPSDEAWYRKVFNLAHNIDDGITRDQDPKTATARDMDESHKDEYFKEKISSDEELLEFVRKMGNIVTKRETLDFTPGDESEVDEYNRLIDLQYRIPVEVHPSILANAYGSTTHKNRTAKSIKTMRTIMTGPGVRFYRDIYSEVMNDQDLKPQVIDERLPDIDEPGFEDISFMSITQKIELAESIEAADLRSKLLSGQETAEGAAEKVIIQMDKDIAKLNAEIVKMQEEIDSRSESLNDQEKRLSSLYAQYTEAQLALDKETKQIRKKSDADAKYQIPSGDIQNALSLEKKVQNLHEQIKKLRVSDKVKATVKRHEALAKLKDDLRKKQKEKDLAKQIKADKIKRARSIMVKPSAEVDYEYAQKIYKIQAMLDPKFRQDGVMVDGQWVKLFGQYKDQTFLDTLEESTDEEIREAVGERAYMRLKKLQKPLNDWTIAELEEMSEEVSYLRSEGRMVWKIKEGQRKYVAEQIQREIIRNLHMTGKFKPRPLFGSKEDQEQQKNPKHTAWSLFLGTWNIDRKAQMLDNDEKGTAYKLLVRDRRKLQSIEWRNVDRRQQIVLQAMKDADITEKDLYEPVEIKIDGQKYHVTKSYLGYAYLANLNQDNRDAISYGVLVSVDEKAELDHDNDLIRELGDKRFLELMEWVNHYLVEEDPDGRILSVVNAIRVDLNSQADRINEISIREYNQAMTSLDNYLPMHRRDQNGESLPDTIAEDFRNMYAGASATGVEKGFTTSRQKISPDHQGPIDMDLINVWNSSVKDHEHMIAFAEYGRKLNRVFKNYGSEQLKSTIIQTYGREMMDDINEAINEAINPQSFKTNKQVNKLIRFLRGNLGAAYLAWKTSNLVLQAITSPVPSWADVKLGQLVKAYRDIALHPSQIWEMIEEKSPMMKNRSANVIIERILEESKTYTDKWIVKANRKQQEIGTLGLTIVDRVAVAGGWLAAYRQKMSELMGDSIDTIQADTQAIAFADEMILRTQPTGDSQELSPMFKQGGEAVKAFTQFQAALNVIWMNISYDSRIMMKNAFDTSKPDAVRKAELKRVIKQVAGYAFAGIALGAIAEGMDDDDEGKDAFLKWVYWSTTQFTGSVPLMGDVVDNLALGIMTNDTPFFFSDSLMPAAENIGRGVVNITQEKYLQAVKNISTGFGYATGLPVSGAKEAWRFFNEGPEAALGRRK